MSTIITMETIMEVTVSIMNMHRLLIGQREMISSMIWKATFCRGPATAAVLQRKQDSIVTQHHQNGMNRNSSEAFSIYRHKSNSNSSNQEVFRSVSMSTSTGTSQTGSLMHNNISTSIRQSQRSLRRMLTRTLTATATVAMQTHMA